MARLKLGVLISGRGSNLSAISQACASPDYPAEIALVVCNRANAPGIAIARQAGHGIEIVDHGAFADRAAFDADVTNRLRAASVEVVCLAGFDRLFSPAMFDAWPDRIVNIHPSLLPSFKGLGRRVHEQALQAGVKVSGCTVHFVRLAMDSGPIIAQACVPVAEGDTPDSLAQRVLAAEHRLYPAAIALIAEGRVQIDGAVARVAAPDGAPPR